MLNKENYEPWSSRHLRYAKSRPNGKLIHNSILNGPHVRKMILEPGDANREITVTETFHLQTDDELSDKELKQIKADDQAIQTILLGLPEDIYATVDSCETAQEIWLRVQQMMKGSNIGIQEKKAKFFNEWEREDCQQYETQDPLALMANSNNPYAFLAPHQDQPSFNQNYLQQPMLNPEDITDPTTAMNIELALMAKAFKLNYSTPTNNNQRISSNPRNRQIAQPGMNMGQDRQIHMVGGNGGNQFRQYAGQNARNPAGYNDVIRNQVIQNAVQNPRVQNVGNQNGLIGVQWNGNQNQIGNGHYARNCTVRLKRRDAAYLQTQLLIAQKEEVGIQLQAEEYDLMAAAADLDEIEEVNANCILMANLQQALTSGTQTGSAPVHDTDGSTETKDLHTADYTQLYDFLKYNQKEVDELKAKQLAKTQDPLALMANSNNPYVIQNAIQNPRVQNGGNQNGLIGVQGNGNQNQIGNGNLVAARAEGNTTGQNGNQIRCYNCRGVGHYARNYTVRPWRRDDAYLQTQLLIAQKE
nr:ribonuclease H-like domain-containing protein [Tanacetum cinerariifolium]